MFIKTIIFPESKQAGKNVRGSNLFQGDGAQLLFFYRTCCFPEVPDSLSPHPGFVHCLCARVHVCGLLKSPKRSVQ